MRESSLAGSVREAWLFTPISSLNIKHSNA
jgi:hypothetical protein